MTDHTGVTGKYTAISKDGDTLTISQAGAKTSAQNNTDEDTEDTTDLSEYSKSELQSMLCNGTIARAEYNEENRSREQ